MLGHKIEVMVLDNKCNPSVNVTSKLVEAKVVAIIGAHCSSAVKGKKVTVADVVEAK